MNSQLEQKLQKFQEEYQDFVKQVGTRAITFTLLNDLENSLKKSSTAANDNRACAGFADTNPPSPVMQARRGAAVIIPGPHSLEEESIYLRNNIKEILKALLKETNVDIHAIHHPPQVEVLLSNYMKCTSIGVFSLIPDITANERFSLIMLEATEKTINTLLASQIDETDEISKEEITTLAQLSRKITAAAVIVPYSQDPIATQQYFMQKLNPLIPWLEDLYNIKMANSLQHNLDAFYDWFIPSFYSTVWEISKGEPEKQLNKSSYFSH